MNVAGREVEEVIYEATGVAEMAGFKVPKRVVLAESLPKNPSERY